MRYKTLLFSAHFFSWMQIGKLLEYFHWVSCIEVQYQWIILVVIVLLHFWKILVDLFRVLIWKKIPAPSYSHIKHILMSYQQGIKRLVENNNTIGKAVWATNQVTPEAFKELCAFSHPLSRCFSKTGIPQMEYILTVVYAVYDEFFV